MFGWSIIARACRSASKRAITSRVSMPGLMIFRATLRRTGSRLLGHVDHAHPAFADLLQELVRPDDRARPFGDRLARWLPRDRSIVGRRLDEAAGLVGGTQQGLNSLA